MLSVQAEEIIVRMMLYIDCQDNLHSQQVYKYFPGLT